MIRVALVVDLNVGFVLLLPGNDRKKNLLIFNKKNVDTLYFSNKWNSFLFEQIFLFTHFANKFYLPKFTSIFEMYFGCLILSRMRFVSGKTITLMLYSKCLESSVKVDTRQK
jgi:hypothetical protein